MALSEAERGLRRLIETDVPATSTAPRADSDR
jgi:hypothetical protein